MVAFVLLGIMTVYLVCATAMEHLWGVDMYHCREAVALWTVLAVAAACVVVRRRRAMAWATLLLHFSFPVILCGAAITYFTASQSSLRLAVGEHVSEPVDLTLRDCYVEYYPGTRSPMDYVSEVVADGSEHRISMNNVLEIRGYRFYQTAMGEDYTVLSVSHDPWGIGVTYAGYALLFFSMGTFFFMKRSRWRSLVGMLLVGASLANAAPKTLQAPLAENFGKMYVYWGGRVCPVQTLAKDFCMKVYGKQSYEGLTAEQVLTGWIFYYDQWKSEPMVKVKDAEVRGILGIDSKYASLKDFFANGNYALGDSIALHLDNRAMREADEKVQLIAMVASGSALKIFPYGDGHDIEWLSWADQLPAALPLEDYDFIVSSGDELGRLISHGRFNAANDVISRIIEYQGRHAGAGNLPSAVAFKAERIANGLGSCLWLAVGLILLGAVGLLVKKGRAVMLVLTALAFAYLSFVIALRWIVGGHLPLGNGFETMQCMAWISLLLAMIFRRLRAMAVLVGGLALMVATMGESNPTVSHLIPVLASPLLSVHVMLVMSAYALFAIMAVNSAVGFAREEAARLSTVLLYPAEFLLAAGIFVGAVWANQSWGRYWGWDPKETWALITLLVYAFPMHAASLSWFRPARHANLYYILAFASVLFTYFGVNFLLRGLHSYAG